MLHLLRDIFDLKKVCYTSVETLAEDMLLLHRCSGLLLAYRGADAESYREYEVGCWRYGSSESSVVRSKVLLSETSM